MLKLFVGFAALASVLLAQNTYALCTGFPSPDQGQLTIKDSCQSITHLTTTLHTTLTVYETLTATKTETVTLVHASAIVSGPVAGGTFYYAQPAVVEISSAIGYPTSTMAPFISTPDQVQYPNASAVAISTSAQSPSEVTVWITTHKTIDSAQNPGSTADATSQDAASRNLVTTYFITETSTIYSTIIDTLPYSSVSASFSSAAASSATSFPFSSISYGGWNNTGATQSRDGSTQLSSLNLTTIATSALPNNTTLVSSRLFQTATGTANDLSTTTSTTSTIASRTSSLVSSIQSPGPRPSTCGESGNFTLDWDDEPLYNPSPTDPIRFPPVFNPYHHLFFSNGYAYAPPPKAPFTPISPPHMAIFLPNGTTKDIGSPSAAGEHPGELGAGPRAYMSAYWFNIDGAYIGCDNDGPDGCLVEFVGFQHDPAGNTQTTEKVASTHSQALRGCPGYKNCTLTHVSLPSTFTALSGLQIVATVNDAPVVFWLDNLSMGWYNNTCEAGLLRQMSRK